MSSLIEGLKQRQYFPSQGRIFASLLEKRAIGNVLEQPSHADPCFPIVWLHPCRHPLRSGPLDSNAAPLSSSLRGR